LSYGASIPEIAPNVIKTIHVIQGEEPSFFKIDCWNKPCPIVLKLSYDNLVSESDLNIMYSTTCERPSLANHFKKYIEKP
jgi:hypothetical protein